MSISIGRLGLVPSTSLRVARPRRTVARTLLAGCLIVLLVVIVLPLCLILIESVVSDDGGAAFTTTHVVQVASNTRYWAALGNTLGIGVATTLVAVVIGVALSWIFVRAAIPGAVLLERLSTIPIFIPPFVGAFAWILLGAPRIGLINVAARYIGLRDPVDIYDRLGMTWVMGIYLAPYVMLSVAAALRNMDPAFEEAAQVCGFGRLRTALIVTLPVIAPAILSAATLVFVIAIGLFGTPALLGWTHQIMLVTSRLYLEWQQIPPAYGVIGVLSFVLMLLSAGALGLQSLVLRGRVFTTVSGKGYRPKPLTLGGIRYGLAGVVWLYLVITVFTPLIVVAAAAVSTYVWSSVGTLRQVESLWTVNDVATTLFTTLEITFIAATVTTALGILLVWLSRRSNLRSGRALEYVALLPLSVPGIAFGAGVGFLWLRIPAAVYGSIWIIILAYIGRYVGYTVRTVSASLVQIHPELEESARVCGFSAFRTFWQISLPLVRPSIAASWIFLYSVFTTELSMVAILYSGDSRTIAVYTFQTWFSGNFSFVASLSLLQLLVGAMVMLVVQSIGRRSRLLAP